MKNKLVTEKKLNETEDRYNWNLANLPAGLKNTRQKEYGLAVNEVYK